MLCWLGVFAKRIPRRGNTVALSAVEQNFHSPAQSDCVMLPMVTYIWYIISFSPKAYSFAEGGDTEKLNCQNTEQNAKNLPQQCPDHTARKK